MDSYLSRYNESLRGRRVSPALPERLLVVQRLLEPRDTELAFRSIASPSYLTDLGIRKISDPSDFYTHHCKIGQVDRVSTECITNYLMKAKIKNLYSFLDGVLLLCGDYDILSEIILNRYSDIFNFAEPKLLIGAGSILAACKRPECEQLYELGYNIAQSDVVRYSFLHRWATSCLKRFSNSEKCEKLLRIAESELSLEGTELAQHKNLSALSLLLNGGSRQDASHLLNDALSAIDDLPKQGKSQEFLSMLFRYRCQISINLAQLLQQDGLSHEAIDVLNDNFEYSTTFASEYLGEASASLSYVSYLMQDFKCAYKYAIAAILEYSRQGSLAGLSMARKVFLSSGSKCGELDDNTCESLANSFIQDPLGLESIRLVVS